MHITSFNNIETEVYHIDGDAKEKGVVFCEMAARQNQEMDQVGEGELFDYQTIICMIWASLRFEKDQISIVFDDLSINSVFFWTKVRWSSNIHTYIYVVLLAWSVMYDIQCLLHIIISNIFYVLPCGAKKTV